MAESKPVLLKFLPHNFKKLVDFGVEHMWKPVVKPYKKRYNFHEYHRFYP